MLWGVHLQSNWKLSSVSIYLAAGVPKNRATAKTALHAQLPLQELIASQYQVLRCSLLRDPSRQVGSGLSQGLKPGESSTHERMPALSRYTALAKAVCDGCCPRSLLSPRFQVKPEGCGSIESVNGGGQAVGTTVEPYLFNKNL